MNATPLSARLLEMLAIVAPYERHGEGLGPKTVGAFAECLQAAIDRAGALEAELDGLRAQALDAARQTLRPEHLDGNVALFPVVPREMPGRPGQSTGNGEPRRPGRPEAPACQSANSSRSRARACRSS